jgi:hypothetical protein
MSDDEEMELTLVFLESRRIDEAAGYVRRGRHMELIDTDTLKARWVTGFKEWAVKLNDYDRRPLTDIEAELYLRGTDPPLDAVKADYEVLRKATRSARLNPEELARLDEWIEDEIEEFRQRIDDPKKN